MLFDNNFKQLVSINNPPIIMMLLLRKKCKNARVTFYNNKRFLYFLIFINIGALFAFILIKLLYLF